MLTRARPGVWANFARPGGGGYLPPQITRKLRKIATSGKRRSIGRGNFYKKYLDHFSLTSKLWPPGAKNCKIFEFFRDSRTSLRKTSNISGTIRDRANRKTAFERELNSASVTCRQIWPKVNRLASRGHQSQKSCFRAKSFSANNFFISKDRAKIRVPSCLSRRSEPYILWPQKVNLNIWPQVKVTEGHEVT